jgi:hypothetical protein
MLTLLLSSVFAHPFSTDEYSLRTSLKVSDKGVSMLVAMEVPIPTALKEIGAQKEESKKVKQKKIDSYTKKQWKLLGNSLTYTIDGKKQKGKWFAIDDPANGKAAEGFFVYLISFQPKKKTTLNNGSIIEITNSAYPDEKMVYSASVYDSPTWGIKASTAQDVLGENQFAPITSEERWTRDNTLRTLKIEIEKKTTASP